jgi:hexosaminidase
MTTLGNISIIPRPVSLEIGEGTFVLDATTTIVANAAGQAEARKLAEQLAAAIGFLLPIRDGRQDDGKVIELALTQEVLGRESYEVNVSPERIALVAATPAGLFYAVQTLLQLLPPAIYSGKEVEGVTWAVPCVQIRDQPRFGWRGAMLDVSRYFMPVAFVKRFIDLLARHKLNTFHWHLTDDQGWRIEIVKYPRLTSVGSVRACTVIGHQSVRPKRYDGIPHGGYYTQTEIREIVAYAQARHVVIVPEIEMPGHTQAAIAAYPALGNFGWPVAVRCHWGISQHILNPRPETIRFIQDGGDEAIKHEWSESRSVQAQMLELGLPDEHALQSWFIRQMNDFLIARGRRLVGWDEILEGGLAAGATVMSWRGIEGGIAAAKSGHDVVMAPNSHTYFDYYQAEDRTQEPLAIGGYIPLEKVYAYDPIPEALSAAEARHILGTQGQLWTEYIPDGSHAEYMAFPRLCALAEVAWTPQEARSYDDFSGRLQTHLKRLEALAVNFRR